MAAALAYVEIADDEPSRRPIAADGSGWRSALDAANAAPRCGAKCRTRGHQPCRNPAMENGRCRMHGGRSTGPRTAEGRERSRLANWRHGCRSEEDIALHRAARACRHEIHRLIALMKAREAERLVDPPPQKWTSHPMHPEVPPRGRMINRRGAEGALRL